MLINRVNKTESLFKYQFRHSDIAISLTYYDRSVRVFYIMALTDTQVRLIPPTQTVPFHQKFLLGSVSSNEAARRFFLCMNADILSICYVIHQIAFTYDWKFLRRALKINIQK